MNDRYFECASCGQVVQGFHASEAVECCNHKSMAEIEPPDVEAADSEEEDDE